MKRLVLSVIMVLLLASPAFAQEKSADIKYLEHMRALFVEAAQVSSIFIEENPNSPYVNGNMVEFSTKLAIMEDFLLGMAGEEIMFTETEDLIKEFKKSQQESK